LQFSSLRAASHGAPAPYKDPAQTLGRPTVHLWSRCQRVPGLPGLTGRGAAACASAGAAGQRAAAAPCMSRARLGPGPAAHSFDRQAQRVESRGGFCALRTLAALDTGPRSRGAPPAHPIKSVDPICESLLTVACAAQLLAAVEPHLTSSLPAGCDEQAVSMGAMFGVPDVSDDAEKRKPHLTRALFESGTATLPGAHSTAPPAPHHTTPPEAWAAGTCSGRHHHLHALHVFFEGAPPQQHNISACCRGADGADGPLIAASALLLCNTAGTFWCFVGRVQLQTRHET
jgi:hypothetical protein